ncbi:hypothetical protein [Streptomyces qinglanensis]|uniref:Uncharacterized protein n=3 Tax=Streptomyces qinglanensis TaxID=943816 RepID=A0A1H9WWI2_9ACTN|nr:hypothetical protein [Streptomyces qinglanensis]SES38288.1 hypothetical protein SAMN05421870_1237 [Streptomyces qinglanensis]
MTAISDSLLDEIRPGAWDELAAGAFDTLLASMDRAQEVCAARMAHAGSPAGADEREHARWLGVSRRISGWRTAIRPDNHDTVEAARAYCAQIVDDYATVRPLHEAVADGRALALTPDGAAVSFEGRWWVARDDRYLPLDPEDAGQAALVGVLERHAAELDRLAQVRAEAEEIAPVRPGDSGNGER